jgi:hypothetical protein
VVSDIKSDDENALVFDGNEVLVNVSTDPKDDITLSDGLGDDIAIELPTSLTDDTNVLTGNDGTVLYHSEKKYPKAELAVQAIDDEVFEGIRLSMIINNASAEHEYDFDFNIPANSKIVTSSEYFGSEIDTGELFIVDKNNELSRIIGAPWAKDANGSSIGTRYVVYGNTVKQIVDFDENTAFPVVADPTLWDDVKCALILVANCVGASLAAKAIYKAITKAGSAIALAKAIYTVIKLKIQNKPKATILKALAAIGGSATLYEYILDIVGITAIKNACVMPVY